MGGPAPSAGSRGVAVAGDVTNSIIVSGDGNVVQLRVDGSDALLHLAARPVRTPLPRPVRAVPPVPRHLVGRAAEAEALLSAVAASPAVELSGEAEVGKTFVALRALSAAEDARLPDGVVCVRGRGKALIDVLQDVHDALVTCDPPAALGEPVLRRELQHVRALVLVDGHGLDREDARELHHALPSCHVVLVAREPVLLEGEHVVVGGLAEGEWRAVAEQELGRAPTAEEHAELAVHEGHPWRVRQAARAMRAPAAPDAAVAVAVQDRLAAAGGAWLTRPHLLDLATPEQLDELVAAGTIVQGSPKFRLPGAVTPAPGAVAALAPRLTAWARQARGRPASMAEDLPAIAFVAAHAAPADALALVRAADAGFAHARALGTWRRLLELALEHARTLGDRSAEAWALHQLGTRAGALDEPGGVPLLHEALALRDALGDPGAAATRHNLSVLLGGGGGGEPADPDPDPEPPSRTGRVLAAAGAACVAGLVVAVIAAGDDPIVADTTSTPTTETTTEPETTTTATTETTTTPQTTTDTTPAGPQVLTVVVTGRGAVRIADRRACRTTCSTEVEPGTVVGLLAEPDEASELEAYDGGGCTPAEPSCRVEVTRPTTVRATFTADPPTAVTATTEGGGSVTCDGGPCPVQVPPGRTVDLAFVPLPGHQLVRVAGGGCEPGPAATTCRVTAPADVTATFAPEPGPVDFEPGAAPR